MSYKTITPLIVNTDKEFGIKESLIVVEDGEEIQLQIEDMQSEAYISLSRQNVKTLIDKLNIWYETKR